MKRYLIIFLILKFPFIVFGQQLPKVVPPSPVAQSMMKYIDYPVNYSSGLPVIDVPIYTIQGKELTLPISLSYHSSGFKPNEKDAFVGQGWTLNAGGRITRQIKNTPDEFCITNLIKEQSEFPFHCYDIADILTGAVGCGYIKNDPEAGYLASAARAYGSDMDNDTEYDVFYFDCPNSVSGKFIFKRNAQNKLLPITLPYRPVVITPGDSLIGHSGPFINKLDIIFFDIIDANGVLYRYGRSLKSGANVTEKSKNYNFSGAITCEGKTSWLLTEMISADKSDTISFEYVQPLTEIKEVHIPYYKTLTKTDFNTSPGPDPVLSVSGMYCTQTNSYTQVQLSSIKFKNGEVKILYANDYYNDQYNKLRIDGVRVYDKKSTAIKKIDFKQSPFSTTSPYWYRLNGVLFSDKNSGITEVFSFDYYEMPNIPGITKSLPVVHMNSGTLNQENFYTFESNAIDYWGFYNGANTNTSTLSIAKSTDCYGTYPYINNLYGDANREIDADYTKVGVLNKITYPTGGNTTYEYEGNKSGYGIPVGGLRVKKITHQDTYLSTISHLYTYGAAISVLGNPESLIKYLDSYKSFSSCLNVGLIIPPNNWTVSITSTNSSSPQIDYNLNAQPITYCEVTEKFGEGSKNAGSIIRSYDTKSLMKDEDMKYDVFPTSNEQIYAPWAGILMSEGDQCNGNPFFGSKIFYQQNFRYGDLFEKEISVYDTTGHIKKRTINNYNQIKKESLMGLYAKRMSTTVGKTFYTNNQFWKRNYYIEQLSQQLDSVKILDYTEGNSIPITTKTSYTNNTNNLPISQMTTKSDGTTIKTTFTHPNEESCTSCAALVTANIITPVITNKDYLVGTSSKLLKTTQTDYNIYGKPLVIKSATYNNLLEDRIIYSYNSSTQNLQTLNKANDVITTYLWSYNTIYPVAQIVNANYADVESVLGSAQNVINFSKKNAPTNDDITSFLAPLAIDSRTKNAQISSYSYSPLIGMTSATDTRGVTTYYSYDTFNRLFLSRNNDKNIIGINRYGFQNYSDNGLGGYSAPTASLVPGTTIYLQGETVTATLSPVSGGSGNYTYTWYLKNSTDSVLTCNLNTTSTSFSYACSKLGKLIIQCVITDKTTGIPTTLSTGISCIAVSATSHFIMRDGYKSTYTHLLRDGRVVTFVIAFSPSSYPMSVGQDSYIANVPDGFQPSVSRTITYTTGERKWEITFNPNGKVNCVIVSGSVLPVGSSVTLGTSKYDI